MVINWPRHNDERDYTDERSTKLKATVGSWELRRLTSLRKITVLKSLVTCIYFERSWRGLTLLKVVGTKRTPWTQFYMKDTAKLLHQPFKMQISTTNTARLVRNYQSKISSPPHNFCGNLSRIILRHGLITNQFTSSRGQRREFLTWFNDKWFNLSLVLRF